MVMQHENPDGRGWSRDWFDSVLVEQVVCKMVLFVFSVLLGLVPGEFYLAEQRFLKASSSSGVLEERADYVKNLSLSTGDLTRLENFTSLLVTPVMYSYSVANVSILPVFRDSLDFVIDNVTSQEQFDQINEAYASLQGHWFGKKLNLFDPQRGTYFLSEFLTPIMQATSTFRFHAQHYNVSLPDVVNSKNSSSLIYTMQTAILTANCWGIVYEYLRTRLTPCNSIDLAVSDTQVAWSFFTNDSRFELLKTSYQGQNDIFDQAYKSPVRNEGLEPGDFVLIWHHNRDGIFLDHAAVFIDEDLYFERAGTGDLVPFRINDWAGITSSWIPGVFEYEFRRLKSTAGPEIPRMGESFGLENPLTQSLSSVLVEVSESLAEEFCLTPEYGDDGALSGQVYTWIEEIALIQGDNGLWKLSKDALNPNSLFPKCTS
eukprot:TRINITY_DN4233_c0_g1_i1.p1 TRINITY_DN4233_c0_g1~~TRINITY_DN4233_c0_g1_i1.p1  ORF type:complete len:430 (-),score=102.35 TRINITY_DN4233_c0_g1_i1:87-1376(-)